MEINYSASQKEINRRIAAYTRMIVSYYLFAIIFGILFIQSWQSGMTLAFLAMAVILFYSRTVVVKYLSSLGHGSVGLSAETLRKNELIFSIGEVRRVNVKKTTGGTIREIHIVFSRNTSTYVNNSTEGIDDFLINLQKFLPPDVLLAVSKEPIDYDHPAFYILFGILLSFISILAFTFLLDLNHRSVRLLNVAIGITASTMGIYFLRYRPIHKHDEKKGQIADSIWGVFFLVAAVAVMIITWVYVA